MPDSVIRPIPFPHRGPERLHPPADAGSPPGAAQPRPLPPPPLRLVAVAEANASDTLSPEPGADAGDVVESRSPAWTDGLRLVPSHIFPWSPADAASREAATYPVAPLLPPGVPVDATAAAWLTDRAIAARAGDRAAQEALIRALGPRIDRWVARRIRHSRPTPRRDGRFWLADDLRQEAWFALSQTLKTWSGEGSFLPWLLAVLPRRLSDRWKTLLGPPLRPIWEAQAEPAPDSHADGEIRLLLESLAARLDDPHDRALLLGHLRDGQPLARLVGPAGATPGAVYARWRRLQAWLRTELMPAREETSAASENGRVRRRGPRLVHDPESG